MPAQQTIVRTIRVGIPIRKVVPSDLLSDLADVRIDSLQHNQLLLYDSDIGKWTNRTALPEELFFQTIDGGSF